MWEGGELTKLGTVLNIYCRNLRLAKFLVFLLEIIGFPLCFKFVFYLLYTYTPPASSPLNIDSSLSFVTFLR